MIYGSTWAYLTTILMLTGTAPDAQKSSSS